MALQLGALRDALIEAGATPDKANKAAEELASYEAQFGDIRAQLKLHNWMLATNLILTVGVLWRVLTLH